MKKIKLSVAAAFLSIAALAQTNWNIDPGHSKIGFSVVHMMLSEVQGNFKKFEGKVTSTKDDFTDSQIEFTMDVASINTEVEKRDEHLRSADFFDAEKFPKITFKSKSFKKVGDKKYKVAGDLTMKGVTKPVEFDVDYLGTVKNPFTQAITAGFRLTGSINRTDYGLKWNYAVEGGGVMVSETVKLDCVVEMSKK